MSDVVRTTPAGLAEERFGGFTATAISCSLCGVGTRGCEWAEAHGWLESWWQTLRICPSKTPSDNLTDTHSNSLHSSAAFILESIRRASISGETGKWPNNGHRERVLSLSVHGTGLMFLQRLLLLLHGPAVEPQSKEKDSTSQKRPHLTKEGKAGRVCTEKQCPRSV